MSPTHGQVQQAFAAIERDLGGFDVVINNAGISIRHSFLDITPDEWNRVLAVNLTGVFYVAQTAARYMMEHDGGVILNTASTNGIVGYPYYADYNASKAGVIELTRSMALELAPKVRVNAVAPGICSDSNATRRVLRRNAGGGEPEDPASAACPARGSCCAVRVPSLRGRHLPQWTRIRDRRRGDCWRAGKPMTMTNSPGWSHVAR